MRVTISFNNIFQAYLLIYSDGSRARLELCLEFKRVTFRHPFKVVSDCLGLFLERDADLLAIGRNLRLGGHMGGHMGGNGIKGHHKIWRRLVEVTTWACSYMGSYMDGKGLGFKSLSSKPESFIAVLL